MHTATTPRYINRGGEQVFCQPFEAQHARMYGYVLRGKEDNLRSLCNKYLNIGPICDTEFRPASEHVLLTFIDYGAFRSNDPGFGSRGFLPEKELALWVLLEDVKRMKLVSFVPYMFVDSSYAMAAGREIFGLPKQLGWFEMPAHDFSNPAEDGPPAEAKYRLETVGVRRFSQESRWTRQLLIEVEPPTDGSREGVFDSLKLFLLGLSKHVDSTIGSGLGGILRRIFHGIEFSIDAFHTLLSKELVMVSLKQFRDLSDGQLACFQCITEFPTHVTKFHGGGIVHGAHRVTIAELESHPVCQELGVEPSATHDLGFWADVDMVIEDGTDLWRAPNSGLT